MVEKGQDVEDLLEELEGKKGDSTGKGKASAKKSAKTKLKPAIAGMIAIKKLVFSEGNRPAEKDAVKDLARSIEKYGVMIPIIVNKNSEVLDGERRVRACELLGVVEIPFIAKETGADETMLIANYIRKNLTKDEARALVKRIQSNSKQTQIDVANNLGISQGRISQLIGKRSKSKRPKVKKNVRKVELPENIKLTVFKSKVELTFVLNESMMVDPLKSITTLFKEMKKFQEMVKIARKGK